MTIPLGRLTIMAALLSASSLALASETEKSSDIEAALSQIRDAAIASKPEIAASLFAEDLALISQSGKLYGKEAALFDLGNPFTAWDNSEVVVREWSDNAIVTFVNNRTRAGMEPAEFLVMQVWRKDGDRWVMAAQSSTAIKKKTPPAPN